MISKDPICWQLDMTSDRRLDISMGETSKRHYYSPEDGSGNGRLHLFKRPSDSNPNTPHYLNMDYELHQGTKLEYFFFESTRLLGASEVQLLKAHCERERTEILTILLLSMENARLARYMLTGNRSMFLKTDDSLAWLYDCPDSHSLLHSMNQCYDRIPIFYKGVVAITRQTYPNANVPKCSDRNRNLFQLDMEDKDTWFTLNPSPKHRDRPAIFGPKDIQQMITRSFPGSQDAGKYTLKQVSEFWDNIFISAASRNDLEKFSRELIVPSMAHSGPESFAYYAPRTDFHVDALISPGYFENQYLETFVSISYVPELCGAYFGAFLFIKFVIDITVLVFRYLELRHFTGNTLSLTKTLLSASYTFFFTSVLTSVFTSRAILEDSIEERTKREDEIKEVDLQNPRKKSNHFTPPYSASLLQLEGKTFSLNVSALRIKNIRSAKPGRRFIHSQLSRPLRKRTAIPVGPAVTSISHN